MANLKWSRLMAALWIVCLPLGAQAFSFGTFGAGEQILSIELSSASGGGSAVTYDDTSGILTFQADVSTITTNLQTYNITLGTVLFDSQVMLTTESVVAPFAPFFGGLVTAGFTNGLAADLSITDIGVGGSGTLLAADYVAPLAFQADSPLGFGFPVGGSLDGDFNVLGGSGDATFEAAFGSAGNYFAVLANFVSSGVPVTTDICGLIEPVCVSGASLDDFTVNPTATIIPVAVPEPTVGLLLLAALAVARSRFVN